ncbi:amidohydrolase family protein [Alteromonas aestuariivivens]|uniref:amidohydrolase family protein n=1 Tax=Alteromonas aestuariivivens TaxID=1938339 RepID=UPI0015F24CA7|nr:amidohydrolase family protein [Alteromonas aestuariivivens]
MTRFHLGKQALISLAASLSFSLQAATQLFSNATIVPVDTAQPEHFKGYLLIEDERIVELGAGQYSGAIKPDSVIDAQGKIILPGFVSGHNHLWQSAFRGIAQDQELHGWLQALHRTYGQYFGSGDFYHFTLHGALDQLAHGITTCYNHSQRLASGEQDYLESLTASLDSGQNTVFAYNPDLKLTDSEVARNFNTLVQRYADERQPLNLMGFSLNAVANFYATERLGFELSLARQHNITLQYHYLEPFEQAAQDRLKWPLMKQAGAAADFVSFAHFVHPDESILQDIAQAGGAMIWNPLSNGRLASGLPDIPRYLKTGLKVGMGVDGAASADIADPFENMRMGLYAIRMKYQDAEILDPMTMLRLHTLETAKVLKIDHQVGSLVAGKRADFLILDTRSPLSGPVFDPASHVVFSLNASNIEAVYVNGERLVHRGESTRFEEQPLAAEVAGRIGRIADLARDALALE